MAVCEGGASWEPRELWETLPAVVMCWGCDERTVSVSGHGLGQRGRETGNEGKQVRLVCDLVSLPRDFCVGIAGRRSQREPSSPLDAGQQISAVKRLEAACETGGLGSPAVSPPLPRGVTWQWW